MPGASFCSSSSAHLVVAVLGIAAQRAVHVGLGQLGLQRQDGLGVGRGLLRRLTGEHQHLLDVLQVLGADVGHLGVLVQVVVAVGQGQPALIDMRNVHGGVVQIGADAEHEEAGAHAVGLQTRAQGNHIGRVRMASTFFSHFEMGCMPLASMALSSMQAA